MVDGEIMRRDPWLLIAIIALVALVWLWWRRDSSEKAAGSFSTTGSSSPGPRLPVATIPSEGDRGEAVGTSPRPPNSIDNPPFSARVEQYLKDCPNPDLEALLRKDPHEARCFDLALQGLDDGDPPPTREESLRGMQNVYVMRPTQEMRESLLRGLGANRYGTAGCISEVEIFTPELAQRVTAKREELRRTAEEAISRFLDEQDKPTIAMTVNKAVYGFNWREGYADVVEPLYDEVWSYYERFTSPFAKRSVVFSLREDVRPIATERFTSVLEQDPDWRIRQVAAHSLGFAQRGEKAVLALSRAAQSDTDERVRDAAREALADMAERAEYTRTADAGAASAARSAGPPESADPYAYIDVHDARTYDGAAILKTCARMHPDPIIRLRAIHRLGIPEAGPDIITAVTGALQGDRDADVRRAAASVLGNPPFIQSEEVVSALRRAASDDASPDVRREATSSLRSLEPPLRNPFATDDGENEPPSGDTGQPSPK